MSAPSISGLGLPFLLHKIEQMSFTRSQSVQRLVENRLASTRSWTQVEVTYLESSFVLHALTSLL